MYETPLTGKVSIVSPVVVFFASTTDVQHYDRHSMLRCFEPIVPEAWFVVALDI